MNIPAAYEAALASVIRGYAEVGEDTVIRGWQNLRQDANWKTGEDGDKHFPSVDIRATPPQTDDVLVNMTTTATIEMRTKAVEDPDHLEISAIYESVQGVLDHLFDQFFNGETGDELDAFKNEMNSNTGRAFEFGAFTFGDAAAPFDDDGANTIALNFVLHYSRQANVTQ